VATFDIVIPGRDVPQDVRYGSKLVEKLINYVMWNGKKSLARRIVYQAGDVHQGPPKLHAQA